MDGESVRVNCAFALRSRRSNSSEVGTEKTLYEAGEWQLRNLVSGWMFFASCAKHENDS